MAEEEIQHTNGVSPPAEPVGTETTVEPVLGSPTPEPVLEAKDTEVEPPEPVPVAVEANSNVTVEKSGDTVTITEVMPVPEAAAQVSKMPFDTSEQSKGYLASLLPKLKEKLLFRTEKRLRKIMDLARTRAARGLSIRNDDVEKLLHVSDTTASRYLHTLVERGLLKTSGSTKGVKYSL